MDLEISERREVIQAENREEKPLEAYGFYSLHKTKGYELIGEVFSNGKRCEKIHQRKDFRFTSGDRLNSYPKSGRSDLFNYFLSPLIPSRLTDLKPQKTV